jgi:hypothetical protein
MEWFDKPLRRETPPPAPLSDADRNRAITEIKDYAARDVSGGFRNEAEIVQGVVDILSDDFDARIVEPLAAEETRRLLEAHRAAEATWPELTDCDRLDRAFAELESRGIVCRQDFSCCGACGSGEIREEMEKVSEAGSLVRGYAFYHMQDTESAVEGCGLYLNYGATEEGELAAIRIGHEICDALRNEGLTPNWDGDLQMRIGVKLDWKRRRFKKCVRL